jgi:hypothetical protein
MNDGPLQDRAVGDLGVGAAERAAAASPLVSITTRASSACCRSARRSESCDAARGPRASSAASSARAHVHAEPDRLRARGRRELRERGRADRQIPHAPATSGSPAPPLLISASASREGRPGWTSWG